MATARIDTGLLRLQLDLPLSEVEARQRTLPLDVNRLILAARTVGADQITIIAELARCLWLWHTFEERVYVIPIMLFTPATEVVSTVRALNMSEQRVGDDMLLRCDDLTQLIRVMGSVECEELGVFYARSDSAARDTLTAIASYSEPYVSHNAPFFVRQAYHGGFSFFAANHLSLEVLGDRKFVLHRCLEAIRSSFCDGDEQV